MLAGDGSLAAVGAPGSDRTCDLRFRKPNNRVHLNLTGSGISQFVRQFGEDVFSNSPRSTSLRTKCSKKNLATRPHRFRIEDLIRWKFRSSTRSISPIADEVLVLNSTLSSFDFADNGAAEICISKVCIFPLGKSHYGVHQECAS